MRLPNRSSRSFAAQKGFTLVEMAVVLVIIGVILGAVMIGRDAQRNAEYLRIRQSFVNQWALAYNSYYQRVGTPLGDLRTAPRLMVNGDTYNGALGGDLSGVTEPNAICQVAPVNPITRGTVSRLRQLILDAGVELPTGRGVQSEDRYAYLDTNGNPQEIQICFQWNRPGTASGAGNVMVISGLTPDLARSLDAAIDGVVDPGAGSFRKEGVAVGAGGVGGAAGAARVDWLEVNTQNYAGAVGDRESQVRTVVAHYKMNQ